MKISAAQLAELLHGSIEGNPLVTVSKPARIEDAKPGEFTFFDNPKYEQFAYSTRAAVLMVQEDFQPVQPVAATMIRVKDVRSSLAFLLGMFGENGKAELGVSDLAHIHHKAKVGKGTSVGEFSVIESGAVVGENCRIYPQVFIGKNVHVGDNCTIYPGVRILYECLVGDNCILHANAVIGSDGFGFAPQPDKTWKKVPQVGNVVIENNVEIGACTCIDRASLGSTLIESGVKLDNLVHIAHNVVVGKNTAFAAQVGVAGSAKIGENIMLGGQVGVAGHISIADGTQIQAQSGIGSNIKKEDSKLWGSPAFEYGDYLRAHSIFKQLPELEKRVRELEKKLAG